jgi:DNA-directed RNA polymerase specialized sigma24 family protein
MSAALWPSILKPDTIQAASEIEEELETGGFEENGERTPREYQFRPAANLAFYRRHTEKLLRRYLYASMLVGRAPSILSDPVARGWASSRPVRTFEDAVIFVLDIESCLKQLSLLDREILSRIVLQNYTQLETAEMLGMNFGCLSYRFPLALDRLTEKLLAARLLILPQ